MSGCWKGKQDPRTHSSMSWHVGTARDRSQDKPVHNQRVKKRKEGGGQEGGGLGRLV